MVEIPLLCFNDLYKTWSSYNDVSLCFLSSSKNKSTLDNPMNVKTEDQHVSGVFDTENKRDSAKASIKTKVYYVI